ncbi:hypothetical protein Q604_UNBC02293G0002, partial [human gut metagenome]
VNRVVVAEGDLDAVHLLEDDEVDDGGCQQQVELPVPGHTCQE